MSRPSAHDMFETTKVLLRMTDLPTLTSTDWDVLKRASDITLHHARLTQKTERAA